MSGIIGVSPDMRSGIVGAFPAGNVVQVAQDLLTSGSSLPVASGYTDTGLSATITPHFVSSKILVIFSVYMYKNSADAMACSIKLFRDATEIHAESHFMYDQNTFNGASDRRGSCMYYDTPATTALLTYKTQQKSEYGTTAMGSETHMILMEISQ